MSKPRTSPFCSHTAKLSRTMPSSTPTIVLTYAGSVNLATSFLIAACGGPLRNKKDEGKRNVTFCGYTDGKRLLSLRTNFANSGVVPSMVFLRNTDDLNMFPYLHAVKPFLAVSP
jgi:hypothetical protein